MIIWLQTLGGLATAAGLVCALVGALMATDPYRGGDWLVAASGAGLVVTGGILLAHARTIELLEAIAAVEHGGARDGESNQPRAPQSPVASGDGTR